MTLFLEVVFHDNDFSWDISTVLYNIWKMISENNNKEYKTTDLFKELHAKGILLQMIKKGVILSAAGHDIEWATRMYQGTCLKFELKSASKEAARFEEYFKNLKIKFHDNDKFMKEWKNSEHVGLNCRNGAVIIF